MKTVSSKIVITGIGPISSVGVGKDLFWEGLSTQRTNIVKEDFCLGKTKIGTFLKHKVADLDLRKLGVDEFKLEKAENWREGELGCDLSYLIGAARLAIVDSGITYDPENNNVGLIVSHENPGLEEYFTRFIENSYSCIKGTKGLTKESFFQSMLKIMMKSSYELQTFMPLFHLASVFDIHGYCLFLNNACASGAHALEEARQIIRSGKSEVVVIVVGDVPGIYKYLWFEQLGMYSRDRVSRPFCSNTSGFLIGDGATGIVVESLKHAQKRKARIYCEYAGGGFLSESWKVTLPSIKEKYYAKTIRKALGSTKTKPDSIDLLIPHGVGTKLSDKYELLAFQDIFKAHLKQIPMVALKPYFGHNLGGNVLLEVVAAILMLEKNCILPTLNVRKNHLIGELNFLETKKTAKLQTVLKTTCAFAGFDSALVFKRLK